MSLWGILYPKVVSALNFAEFPWGKYLLRKAFNSVSQMEKELDSSFNNQSLALSLKEDQKILS